VIDTLERLTPTVCAGGDVVRAPDPFKITEAPRPWLILNDDGHPFPGEEYVTVTLTTTPHDGTVPIDDVDWVDGGMPRRSYASPWSLASPRDVRSSCDRGDVDVPRTTSTDE